MPRNQVETEMETSQSSGMVLEIDGAGAGPLQFPATVRNFAADLVTLEVHEYWGEAMGPSLVGRGGSLHLTPAGSDSSLSIPGTVTWARDDNGSAPLILGLKLDRSVLTAPRALEALLPQKPRDIQGLWERWDQTKGKPVSKAAFTPMQHYLAGLGLLVGGLTLQLHGGKTLTLFGAAAVVYGGVVIGSTALWHWWRKKRGSP
jgi:hypothetical protein